MTNIQTIKDDEQGIRLDRWFKRYYPGFPHALLEKNLRKGMIRLDGKKAKSSDRLEPGQQLDIRCEVDGIKNDKPVAVKYDASLDDIRMIQDAVIYKDTNVIVINKPYGLAVQGGSKVTKSVDDLLDGLMFDSAVRPKLTHRLDRDTSGVLVLARSSQAAAQLAKAFAGKTMEKFYWALVNGCPIQLRGTIDLPLMKAARDGESQELVGVDEEEGKFAKTEYRVIDQLARKFALMELKPLTGRTHQLRVHMQAIGHPIIGDHKYGGSNIDAKSIGVENVLHLHARRIVIPAMPGIKAIDVSAPLPKHMEKSFRALGLDVPKK